MSQVVYTSDHGEMLTAHGRIGKVETCGRVLLAVVCSFSIFISVYYFSMHFLFWVALWVPCKRFGSLGVLVRVRVAVRANDS